jgi:protein-disulfide isomerase
VTLVEFFDYNCPYCRRMGPVMTQAEVADPKLRIVYKEFPILGPASVFAAKAALAAHKQGKYFAFHQARCSNSSFGRSAAIRPGPLH